MQELNSLVPNTHFEGFAFKDEKPQAKLNLNLLGEQVNQYNQNLNKLEQVGLTDIALDKIPEKDRTTGSKALTNLTLNEVNKQLGVLSDNIAVTDKVIGDYTKGKTVTASQIDSLGNQIINIKN